MKMLKLLSFTFLVFIAACGTPSDYSASQAVPNKSLDTAKVLETITFGSCNRQDKAQPMWPFIVGENPDLWIWLGDNIYADTENLDKMKAMYGEQKSKKGYQKLLKASPVIGIWDDHDYGVNDGDKSFPKKAASKDLMLDFLDVPSDAAVRKREGAYQSYSIGPEGKKVKILLLDARYFRDELKGNDDGYQRYYQNEDGDVLGEAQWTWLEEELKNSDAQMHLIASGIQFIPEEQGFEKWYNFPKAHQRFFDLIDSINPAKTILLSGDRHLAEVSKRILPSSSDPVYEVTSSGLTHSYEAADEPNKYRVSALVGQKNYGVLKIDWSGESPIVRTQVKGLKGKIFVDLKLD